MCRVLVFGIVVMLALLLVGCSGKSDVTATKKVVLSPPQASMPVDSKPEDSSQAVAVKTDAASKKTAQVIGVPPKGKYYHSVFPGSNNGEESVILESDLDAYVQVAGKEPVWVYFSNDWYRSRKFPEKTAKWVRDRGSVPYIRLMLRSSEEQNIEEPVFKLDMITQGDFDSDLKSWAQDAKEFGTPIIAEFGTEVNGEWFPWNAIWYDNDPNTFKNAYIHIIKMMRDEGADNILWVFHVNNNDIPDDDWNRLENYYPGDRYIDWIGVSVYGAQTYSDDESKSFRELLDPVYPRLVDLGNGKPIAVLEFGVTNNNPRVDQVQWAEAALEDITSGRYPAIFAFNWWDEGWQNDDNPKHDTNMRVQDNPGLAKVFKKYVGENPDVLSTAVLTSS